MKLRIISEDIRKTDFFDFYALVHVYLDLKQNVANPEYLHEVEQELYHTARYIYNDQIDQLAEILAKRWIEDGDDVSDNLFNTYQKHGIQLKRILEEPGMFIFKKGDIRRMPRKHQISLIRELITDNQYPNASTGPTWTNIGRFFLDVAKPKTNNQLIRAVDRIYGATHHSGVIADYFDEKDWLEKALNTRTVASPKNLIARTSTRIRELLTSASIGIPKYEEIDILNELTVALNRVARRLDLFDHEYQPIDKNHFKFSLTYRIISFPIEQRIMKIPIMSANYYDNLGDHDQSNDEEHVLTCLGTVENNDIIIQPTNNQNLKTKTIKIGNRKASDIAGMLFTSAFDIVRRRPRFIRPPKTPPRPLLQRGVPKTKPKSRD